MSQIDAYKNFQVYYGDLHSHNLIGYGHGSPEQALTNARLQLDFCSLTAHSSWPDMPIGEPRLNDLVDYHQKGFEKTHNGWKRLSNLTEEFYEPGKFVTFPGFEWHSNKYGDHNIYFRQSCEQILYAPTLDELRKKLRELKSQGIDAMVVPHHIAYKAGYRGIDWSYFSPEFSPVVEILSMHGLGESDQAPIPYLLPMGPRDGRSTMHTGLKMGKVFGVIGSTDHHSAWPGSYGHGRAGIWADTLTRDGLWQAIQARRTYAMTGDRIQLAFSVDGAPMGSNLSIQNGRLKNTGVHRINLEIRSPSRIDYAEVLYRNRVIQRFTPPDLEAVDWTNPVWVRIEVGWGENFKPVNWQSSIIINGGELIGVEPHFRGQEIVAHQGEEEIEIPTSSFNWVNRTQVDFATQTWGNLTGSTSSTQGVSLCIKGTPKTKLLSEINGRHFDASLEELSQGSRTGYVGGFVSPAFSFHKLISRNEYMLEGELEHTTTEGQGWYTARVIQKNGQGAWSSPVWVD